MRLVPINNNSTQARKYFVASQKTRLALFHRVLSLKNPPPRRPLHSSLRHRLLVHRPQSIDPHLEHLLIGLVVTMQQFKSTNISNSNHPNFNITPFLLNTTSHQVVERSDQQIQILERGTLHPRPCRLVFGKADQGRLVNHLYD